MILIFGPWNLFTLIRPEKQVKLACFLQKKKLLMFFGFLPVTRTVVQFHYWAWPDHGVPALVRPLLDMVRLIRDCQASETLPLLIHCSAGCGRTGTICAIDYVWGLLRAGVRTDS